MRKEKAAVKTNPRLWAIAGGAGLVLAGLLQFALSPAWVARAQTFLGTAQSFAVLGGSTVTNTGPSVLRGDLGVWPGLSITGFPPGVVIVPGTIHPGDAVAQLAQNDVTTAYNTLAGMACNTNLTGQDLGGLTLTPGVYCFNTSAQMTGNLTLNALGNPQALFVFQIGSTLTTATNSSVTIINGGQSCNVSWQVGSSATLGTATAFQGNIVALTSITLNTTASLIGRALARNGAVTLDNNAITVPGCVLPTTSTPTSTPTPAVGPTSTFTPTPLPTSTPTPAVGPPDTPTTPPGPIVLPPATAEPLPVQLAGFQAVRSGQTVALSWKTLSEIKNAGFRVWREGQDGTLVPVGPRLIPARGGEIGGATYCLVDQSAPRSALRYWLEDVSTLGAAKRHGPAEVAPYRGRPIVLPKPEPGTEGRAGNSR